MPIGAFAFDRAQLRFIEAYYLFHRMVHLLVVFLQ